MPQLRRTWLPSSQQGTSSASCLSWTVELKGWLPHTCASSRTRPKAKKKRAPIREVDEEKVTGGGAETHLTAVDAAAADGEEEKHAVFAQYTPKFVRVRRPVFASPRLLDFRKWPASKQHWSVYRTARTTPTRWLKPPRWLRACPASAA